MGVVIQRFSFNYPTNMSQCFMLSVRFDDGPVTRRISYKMQESVAPDQSILPLSPHNVVLPFIVYNWEVSGSTDYTCSTPSICDSCTPESCRLQAAIVDCNTDDLISIRNLWRLSNYSQGVISNDPGTIDTGLLFPYSLYLIECLLLLLYCPRVLLILRDS